MGKQRFLKIGVLLKSIANLRNLRIVLFTLAGFFIVAAMALLMIQWREGQQAGQQANALLIQAVFASPTTPDKVAPPTIPDKGASPINLIATFPLSSDIYIQPEAPEIQISNNIEQIVSRELAGFSIIARLDIDKIDLHLPILSKISDKALKVSVCFFSGPEPGGSGNLVIAGHNFKNGAHFGNIDHLSIGDTAIVTGMDGQIHTFTVYKLQHIKPDNPEALNVTKDSKELTLLTCEANGNMRLAVRFRLEGYD
jgi:LPXTG-site transpeptidase (sortase) family protein